MNALTASKPEITGGVAAFSEDIMSKEKKAEHIIRTPAYFESDDFDCSREYLLNEIVCRARYWLKRTDGSYNTAHDDSQVALFLKTVIGENGDPCQLKRLGELAKTTETWLRDDAGNYAIPRVGGQIEQLMEMAISAELKKRLN